ncbi:conserved hypothetical protein [Sporisorium reilianum SRZ2]|uniref:Uncharacterized protein n=1 Tax=Sporisorium reilianum (strain SRZ2) TaxID=999809 RepID=E6ZM10_SPORE|nr:conserved hypothetical protein [Sporisorium reilianum SRZ2]
MTIRRRLLSAPSSAQRLLSTSAHTRYQHVLYLGDVLGYRAEQRFAPFPRAWVDAVGGAADVDHGVRWRCAAGGPNHALLAYTLLDVPLAVRSARRVSEDVVIPGKVGVEEEGQEGEVLEEAGGRKAASSWPSKVYSIGRNTHAQLGLGFASQEATRGMVTGDLSGSCGVSAVVAGGTFSIVITQEATTSNISVFGNDTLGQIGSSAAETSTTLDPYDVSTRLAGSDAPQLRLLPLPKRVEVGGGGWTVKSSAAGVDHTLLLLEREINGYAVQRVVSAGLNADGQLGVTPSGSASVPISPLLSRAFQSVPLALTPTPSGTAGDKIVSVVCGADTSYALTAASDVWVWGNSEYGQTLCGTHDRLAAPQRIANPLPAAYAAHSIHTPTVPRIKTLVGGGAFAGILDTQGRVWDVGHTAPFAESAHDDTLRPVTGLPSVERLFAGLEYLVATCADEVYVWGVLPRSVSRTPVHRPTRVHLNVPRTPRQVWLDQNLRAKRKQREEGDGEKGGRVSVQAAACTRDHVLLVLDDGVGPDVWAECVQPPADKGTDITL